MVELVSRFQRPLAWPWPWPQRSLTWHWFWSRGPLALAPSLVVEDLWPRIELVCWECRQHGCSKNAVNVVCYTAGCIGWATGGWWKSSCGEIWSDAHHVDVPARDDRWRIWLCWGSWLRWCAGSCLYASRQEGTGRVCTQCKLILASLIGPSQNDTVGLKSRWGKRLHFSDGHWKFFADFSSHSCKFLTQEIMGAQNFNCAPTF